MLVPALSLVALAASVSLSVSPASASTDPPFTFDLFTGPQVQDKTSELSAPEVEYTTPGGIPYPVPYDAQRVGTNGPLLLQGSQLIESLAHFHRERIPERVSRSFLDQPFDPSLLTFDCRLFTLRHVGAGAHGYFVTTTDIAKKYSMADVFQRVGEKTPITMRFSTVGGESGSSDEARDPRGFSIKLRTKQGIWDWVWNNTPVFFIRDPGKFPHFIHTQKRDPQTHLKNKNLFWDYLSSNPESLHQVMRLFSDLGTPYGFRHMNGWSGHTYRFVRADGSWNYVKLIAKTDQGVKNFTIADATTEAGVNPDFATQDLFDAIAAGNYPSWSVYLQVLSPKAAETFKYNVLDLTKDWPVDLVPYQEIGKLVLTQNPKNYFAEIEQVAFSPSHMAQGCEPSEDPVLQSHAHRYRLGVNYQSMPGECAHLTQLVPNFQRDGRGVFDDNQGNRPNYESTLSPIKLTPAPYDDTNHTIWIDFDWPRIFWKSLSKTDQDNLIGNVVGHLGQATSKKVKERQVALFYNVEPSLGERIAAGINVTASGNYTVY
ncbi:hypothetical protein BS47DRAFT_1390250 [Hydnum rufescens UP504]|uniref:Catalase core domain-containing protein n=1 Tax=Hydnum rufescens UP504 TaxID=1448309 RepID=A0A9P6E0D8_9AGAM|nr:hypothetical protein BS47DRAFT_1390250 [Hydnum rufescens UP504]